MPITPFTVLPADKSMWQQFLERCIVKADTIEEYTVAELAELPVKKRLAFVTNETGGYVLAFRDASDVWRRCTDRAVCS